MFGNKSVDGALKKLTSVVEDLRDVADAKTSRAVAIDAKIFDLNQEMVNVISERDRAERVIAKLDELLG